MRYVLLALLLVAGCAHKPNVHYIEVRKVFGDVGLQSMKVDNLEGWDEVTIYRVEGTKSEEILTINPPKHPECDDGLLGKIRRDPSILDNHRNRRVLTQPSTLPSTLPVKP